MVPAIQDHKKPLLAMEATIYLNFFVVAICTWVFVKLANRIRRGHTDEIDNQILRAFRRTDDLAIPVGPHWLAEVVRDVTALGSGATLTLTSAVLVGFLALNRRFRAAGFVSAALGR